MTGKQLNALKKRQREEYVRVARLPERWFFQQDRWMTQGEIDRYARIAKPTAD